MLTKGIATLRPLMLVLAMAALALVAVDDGPRSPTAYAEPGGSVSINFQRGELDVDMTRPTTLTFGPDGRLYVAYGTTNDEDLPDMEIAAVTLDSITKQVTDVEVIASGLHSVLGIAFDPTAKVPTLYASRQDKTARDGYWGTVSKFTSPGWALEDVITGLPTSAPRLNHLTNGLAFDDAGGLYIAQGSATNSGVADPPGSELYYAETPLSAAILFADVQAPGFDGTITHSPAGPPEDNTVTQTGGDVFVYAPGFRNPYDLVLHGNGRIYATDNSPIARPYSVTCTTASGIAATQDELNLVEEGEYYGFPNRNRGLNIPDARQCTYHPPQASPGPTDDFVAPIAVLPNHCSCNGMVEYTSDAFGGALQGDLVYAELGRGSISRAVLTPDGLDVVSTPELEENLIWPLDVTMESDGTLYVAEFLAGRITYFAPDSDGDGCSDPREGGPNPMLGGQRDAGNPYDFYDVNGDGFVTVLDDVLMIANAFGPAWGPDYEQEFDRSPGEPGRELWDLGPPDGAINVLDDILGAAAQVGHSCAN